MDSTSWFNTCDMDDIRHIEDRNPTIIDPSLPIDSPLFQVEERILQEYSLDTLENGILDLQFQYSYKICGAITLDKKKLNICSNKAGVNTQHEGVARCYLHDKVIYQPRSPYTKYLRHFDTLQEVFEEFQNREKSLDLGEEVSIAKTALAYQLTLMQKGRNGNNDFVFKNIILALEMVRKIQESISKIKQAESAGITLQSITSYLYQVSEIISQEIADGNIRNRILDRVATEATFFQV